MTGPSDDGQAGVTEADRETAVGLRSEWMTFRAGDGHLSIGKKEEPDHIDAIAAALAAERAKARAPFLALATYWEEGQRKHSEYWVRADAAANAIRRAAEEGQ